MMIAMLIAGIGCLLAGLLAIGFGIPVNEFSFGNTLILSGAIATCTGLIILSLWIAVRELRKVALSSAPSEAADGKASAWQPTVAGALPRPDAAASPGRASHDPMDELAGGPDTAPSAVPWHEETTRQRRETPAEPAAEASPPSRQRRNLMFSSTSRKERERAQTRAAESSEPGSAPSAASPASDIHEAPATFEDAWPKSDRAKPAEAPPQRRAGRAPSTFSQASAAHRPPAQDQPPVTVIKSGVVDGMAYSLYSDGSIEAQMPEGMMRFASIDELRAHLDHRS